MYRYIQKIHLTKKILNETIKQKQHLNIKALTLNFGFRTKEGAFDAHVLFFGLTHWNCDSQT